LWILATYAAGRAGTALDAALERHARRALIDWFAAVFAGRELPAPALLAATVGDATVGAARGPGSAVRYTDGARTDPRHAALVNAAASHAAEFDDGFRDGGHHPGATTISAALACAQSGGATLHRLLNALAAG
jgi:2-methylcitrate dehydratase PrpD